MKKNIIIYYSRSGNTKIVASYLAEFLKCEKIEIEIPKSRKGVLGFIRLIIDGVKKNCSPIIIPDIKWSDYEKVIIGSPIWGGTYASPIHTLLKQQLTNSPNYAIFSVSAGEGPKIIASDMATIIGKQAVAIVNICKKDLKKSGWEEKIQPFLNSLV